MNAFDFMLRNWREILALTGEHLWLVAVSTTIAVAVGIPVGLMLTRRASLKRPVLAVANILQTVPSLALFDRGFRQYDNNLILAGAIPAALLALAADAGLGLIESRFDVRRRAARGVRKRGVLRRVAWAALALAVAAGLALAAWRSAARADVVVGSKDFTESVILAELVSQMLEARGLKVERRYELGGNITHDSLVAGRIDAYPEYTGTSLMAILKHPPSTDARAVYEQVKREYAERFDVEVSPPLGFEDTFAILVRGDDARRLNLKAISDVTPYAPKWRAGFGQDFMSRKDGYEGFARAYDLQFAERPREMDLSLSYRALADRGVDIIAGNSTDGMIATLGLTQLEDDRHYFPPYEAVFLARRDALSRLPQMREVIQKLAGAISTDEMRRLNYQVDGEKRAAADVVREWRQSKGL